jgi:S-(hydroxymethyl)glutathione dehydrogenase/alcohol dehydrogenase
VKAKTALLTSSPGKWEVADVDLDDPRPGELLIRMAASGLCHSDDHLATGDLQFGTYPVAGGHEGSGTVEAIGPNTPGFEVGDHIVMSFLPGCGKCRFCASGMQNLCDLGATLMVGSRADGSFRMTLDGAPVGQMCGISTFSNYSLISVDSAVKIPKDIPLEKACLVGCGVGTGWGSAVNSPRSARRPVSSWASAASASTPFRERRTPVPATSSPSTRSRFKARRPAPAPTAFMHRQAIAFASRSEQPGADSAIITIGI